MPKNTQPDSALPSKAEVLAFMAREAALIAEGKGSVVKSRKS